jgi:phosphoglucomutase
MYVHTGGDGRLLNEHASEIFTRVGSANNIKNIVISSNNFLTASTATSYLQEQARTGDSGIYINCFCFCTSVVYSSLHT